MNYMNLIVPRTTSVGSGALNSLPQVAADLGSKAFVLVYANNQDLQRKIGELLGAREVKLEFCETREGEPEISYIDACAAHCKQSECDYIVSVGGGSIIDTGKAVAMLQTNDGSVRDFQMGTKQIRNKAIPHIAVPTTAGTGAEATKASVVTNKEARVKKSVIHPSIVPNTVILDAELTQFLPPRLTALTGLDALSHAMESYVSLGASPYTEACAAKSIELIGANLAKAVKNGEDSNSRTNMLYASYLAGLSLNGGLGAAHILAQPLSTVTGLSHSLAIAILLPQVVSDNLSYSKKKYAQIASILEADVGTLEESEAAQHCSEALSKLYRDINISDTLGMHGVKESDFKDVLEVVNHSTRHIATNPKPVTDDVLIDILSSSL